jgi:hypothetical protein
MRPFSLLAQVCIAGAVLGIANVGIQKLSANSLPRQLMRKCEQAAPATDLFLGNSTMAAGLDEAAFDSMLPGHRALNAALGSSGPVEHYLVFERQDRHKGAAVFYGFLDTQLTDPVEGDWATLVGNRAMAYYFNLDSAVRFYAPLNRLKELRIRVTSAVPVLVERYAMWARVERLRRLFGEVGLPRTESGRFGRLADFALLEPAEEDKFATRCAQDAALSRPLSPPIMSILTQSRQAQRAVYVIEMPMPTSHRRRFYSTPEWSTYRSHLILLIKAAGGLYVPAADWVENAGFEDPLHLNPKGAAVFSKRLAQFISDNSN